MISQIIHHFNQAKADLCKLKINTKKIFINEKKLFLKNIHNFSSLDIDLLHILSHVIYLLKVEHTNFPAIDIYDILIFWNLIKKTASNGKSTG